MTGVLSSSTRWLQQHLRKGLDHASFSSLGPLHFSYGSDRIVEPLELWLSIFGDAAPFVKDVHVCCPSMWSAGQEAALRTRCRRVFPSAVVQRVSVQHQTALQVEGQPPLPPSLRVPSVSSGFSSSLDTLPSHSRDLVVFSSNVFGHEMLFQCPLHISAVHRVLKRHGIFAVLGRSVAFTVVSGPEEAARDLTDYFDDHQAEVNLLSWNEEVKRSTITTSSIDSAHGDVYFPFPSVKRRWFESEHAMSPLQLINCCRTIPTFHPCYASRRRSSLKKNETSDFVDEDSDLTGSEGSFVVQRTADPLDGLLRFWKIRNLNLNEPMFRVRMLHFVVTCSSRSVDRVQLS